MSNLLRSIDKSCFETFGSQIVRNGACRMISSLCQARILTRLGEKSIGRVAKEFWEILRTSLCRAEEPLHTLAATALQNFIFDSDIFNENILETCLENIAVTKDKHSKRGFGMALGYLPVSILKFSADRIVQGLMKALLINDNSIHNDAEARKNAMHSLTRILQSFRKSIVSDPKNLIVFQSAVNTYVIGMDDYSYDSRGDVGSWIRDASMHGIKLVLDIAKSKNVPLAPTVREELVGFLVLSCLEKIDRLRETAGTILTDILLDSEIVVPNREVLQKLLVGKNINWLNSAEVFPVLSQCLYVPALRNLAITGIVNNIGGLTESLVRSAIDSLSGVLNSLPFKSETGETTTADDIVISIRDVFAASAGNERLVVPMIETLDIYMNMGFLMAVEESSPVKDIFNLLKKEIFKSKNTKKLLLGIKVLTAFASLNDPELNAEYRDIQALALEKLVLYLAHPYPIVI